MMNLSIFSQAGSSNMFFSENSLGWGDDFDCNLKVVFVDTKYNLNTICRFPRANESDTCLCVNLGIMMNQNTGEILGFLVVCSNYCSARGKWAFEFINVPVHLWVRLPASSLLAALILLICAEGVRAQWVNPDFSSGATGWTSTAPANSSLTYSGGVLTAVSKNNGGSNQRTIASQTLTDSDPGFFSYTLSSWTTGDIAHYDYPTAQIGGTYYWIRTTGVLSTGAGGASIDNSDAPIGPISGVRVVPDVAVTIGVGVTAVDSCCGVGTAVWDDVDVQQLTQSPSSQTTPFNTTLTLSSANAPQVATNSGAATMVVTLSVTNGVVNLGTTAGVTITAGADGSSSVTISGSPANLNTAMDGLAYTPTSGFFGASTLTFFANGGGTSDTDTIGITVGSPTFSFTITKTTPTGNVTSGGSLINYTITVTNTGTGSLSGISISDNLVQGAAITALSLTGPTGDGGVSGIMEAGEVWGYTASHAVTQAQMDDAGDLINTVTFDSAETAANTASATTTITATPSLSVVKSSSAPGFVTDSILEAPAGTNVTYTYTVTNNGNQTMANIDIDDSGHTGLGTLVDPVHGASATDNGLPGGSADTNGDPAIWGQLGPLDVVTFTTTYTITQADIDAQ